MVKNLLAARGVVVSHQTVRLWAKRFSRTFANEIRRHFNPGKRYWLWRAVDQDGFVLKVLVQNRRNAKAAKRLIRKLMRSQGRAPRVIIADKLRSYAAAKRNLMPIEHRSHKGVKNRAENSHQPDPATRADHEAIQVTARSTTLRLHP